MGQISNPQIIAEAITLYETLSTTQAPANLIPLYQITQGQLVSPDDWALVQESYPSEHPYTKLFTTYRSEISSQYLSNNKKCTAVPIITFTHENTPYVLLMENKGLANSADVKSTQWTAHGVRVDAYEKDKVTSERWNLYQQISSDIDNCHFIAAAVRRLADIGIAVSDDIIKQICQVNREAAGYPEKPNAYRTEYLNIDLGNIPVSDIEEAISKSPSRYAKWTQCFKLSDLHAAIQPDDHNVLRQPEKYILNYNGKTLPIRSTTWFFLVALQLAKEMQVQPEGLIKDPWQLRNIRTIELAFNWLVKWTDKANDGTLQITLMDERHNHLTPAQIQVFSALTGIYDENLAYTSLHQHRLTLHLLIAHLTVFCKFADAKELEGIVKTVYPAFIEQHSQFQQYVNQEFNNQRQSLFTLINLHLLSDETTLAALNRADREDIERVRSLLATINSKQLSPLQKNLYHLRETPQEIATLIRFHEKHHNWLKPQLIQLVGEFITKQVAANNLHALEAYPLNEHLTFGVSGPVASGKSTSEELIHQQLGDKGCAVICSDEWNDLLSDYLRLNPAHYAMPRGLLTLAEAWFIKEVIWTLLNNQVLTQQKVPHWIHETCDPSSVIVPTYGQTHIYANTADPTDAAQRVKERGDRSGRYVSASVATGSYRWTWPNFLKTLTKFDLTHVTLFLIDTDVVYAPKNRHLEKQQRLERAKIAVVEQQELRIHDMLRFIHLIERGYRINPAPKNSHPNEIWLPDQPASAEHTLREFRKLFIPQLTIKFQEKTLSEADMELIINQHYSALDTPVVVHRASVSGFFSGAARTTTTNTGQSMSLEP